MTLTPEVIELIKEEINIQEYFVLAEVATAKHLLYEEFIQQTKWKQLTKLVFYILMDELFPIAKATDGNLGYKAILKEASPETNIQLPVNVIEDIQKASIEAFPCTVDLPMHKERIDYQRIGYIAGATEYATKQHKVEQERDQYRRALEEISRGVFYPQRVARGALLSLDQIIDNSKDQPTHY